jgi:hypothetical protein
MSILCDNKIILLIENPDGGIIRFFSHELTSVLQFFQDINGVETQDFTKDNVVAFELTVILTSTRISLQNENTSDQHLQKVNQPLLNLSNKLRMLKKKNKKQIS